MLYYPSAWGILWHLKCVKFFFSYSWLITNIKCQTKTKTHSCKWQNVLWWSPLEWPAVNQSTAIVPTQIQKSKSTYTTTSVCNPGTDLSILGSRFRKLAQIGRYPDSNPKILISFIGQTRSSSCDCDCQNATYSAQQHLLHEWNILLDPKIILSFNSYPKFLM